jgi:hypothetical protein
MSDLVKSVRPAAFAAQTVLELHSFLKYAVPYGFFNTYMVWLGCFAPGLFEVIQHAPSLSRSIDGKGDNVKLLRSCSLAGCLSVTVVHFQPSSLPRRLPQAVISVKSCQTGRLSWPRVKYSVFLQRLPWAGDQKRVLVLSHKREENAKSHT